MAKTTPDLGEPCPIGHPSGRVMLPPVSVKMAKVRVTAAMRHFEANVRDGIDVGYAIRCLDEAQDDYFQMVLWGKVDADRVAALEAEVNELAAECAEAQAEAIVRQAMRDLEGGTDQ